MLELSFTAQHITISKNFIDEGNGGLRFSGFDACGYPAYRHCMSARFAENRKENLELLRQWLEATVDEEGP